MMADKKKKMPLHHRDQSLEQRDFLKNIDSHWDSHPVVKNFHGKWAEWIKWFEGDQYMFYNEYTGKIEDIAPKVERRVKNVYNRTTPMIRQVWGQMRFRHEFYAEPNTSESEDIQAARLSSRSLEFTNASPKWQFHAKMNLAKLWALITGNIYWKEWWNKDLWAWAINEKGKVFKAKGDIDCALVNPFNIRTDPLSKIGRKGWRWSLEGQRVPLTSLAAEFGVEVKDLAMEPYEKSDVHMFEREEFQRSDEDTGIRKEYYEIPSKDYPDGRMVVSAGQWMFYDDKNPNPESQLPHFHFKGLLPILDEDYGDSLVRLVQEAQRSFNRLCSMVDEQIEDFRLKGLIPFGSLRPHDDAAYRRAGVDFLEYNPRIGVPHIQSPPEVSQTIINWIGNIENEIREQGSVRDVSMAQLPKYATRASGVLFKGLKEQDEVVLIPMIEDWDANLEEVMAFRLQLIQQHWKMKRMVKLYGKKAVETSVAYFSGADIKGNTDVRVKPGVDLFSNRAAKQEAVGMMVEKGMFEDPKEVLEILELGGTVEEYMEDQFVDKRQANRHLETMKNKNTYVEGHEDDNHQVHYTVFNNFRKSDEFENIPKKRQENIQKRIDYHKDFIGMQSPPAEGAEGGATEAAPAPEAGVAGPLPGAEEIPPEILEQITEEIITGEMA